MAIEETLIQDGADKEGTPLPRWNLADLYPAPDSPVLQEDLKRSLAEAVDFESRHKGRLGQLSGAEFGAVLREYERIDETLARLSSYAQLLYAADLDNPETARFQQMMQERTTDISTHLLFFGLELNRLDDSVVAKLLDDDVARRYTPWVRTQREFRDHQLSDDLERLLHEKHVAGRASWVRLFDETMAGLRFPYEGPDLFEAEVRPLPRKHDRETVSADGPSPGCRPASTPWSHI